MNLKIFGKVADGYNSAGDVVATGIALVGYRYARKPPDADHHYGHGNAESVAGLAIGGILLATGVFIAIDGTLTLCGGAYRTPGLPAVWAAIATAVIKEGLYRYTIRAGRRLRSPALLASARDHRADVFVALTVVGGLVGSHFDMPWLDPATAIVVGIYVASMAIEPLQSNLAVLMDSAPPELRDALRAAALEVPEVRDVPSVRVHPVGANFRADLEVCLDAELNLRDAHAIAHAVSDHLVAGEAAVVEVLVHVNPAPGATPQNS